MTQQYEFSSPPPFEHQVEGLKRLIASNGVYALLWDPGTGKSRTVVDYLGVLAVAGQGTVRCLVMCPKAVTDSWVTQAKMYLTLPLDAVVLEGTIQKKAAELACQKGTDSGTLVTSPSVQLRVMNLEAMSSRRVVKGTSKMHSDLILDAVKKYKPHVLVVDEAHRVKGNSSNAARLLARIAPHVPRRILLTGTPMPHSPLDVWSQWKVLEPTAFATNGRSWSFSQFRAKYGILGGFMGKEVTGFHYLDDLERRIAPTSMPLRKEDALDLPPTTDVTVLVRLEPAELKAYAAMKKDLLVALESGLLMSAPSRLTQLLRLRQITSGFVKGDDGSVEYTGTGRQAAALSLLEDLLATERRVVVFAWARPEIDRLVEAINSSSSLYGAVGYGITGDTPDAERLRIRQGFAKVDNTRQVVVAQWRTISLGVNELTAASSALFLSLSQQRDDLIQGRGRLDRQGQTRPVTFYYLTAPGTVDEVIRQSHEDRTNLEDQLLRHIKGIQ